MKLKRFLLRYYPPGSLYSISLYMMVLTKSVVTPDVERDTLVRRDYISWACLHPVTHTKGIILEYQKRDGSRNAKEIDLLHLTPEWVCENFLFFFQHRNNQRWILTELMWRWWWIKSFLRSRLLVNTENPNCGGWSTVRIYLFASVWQFWAYYFYPNFQKCTAWPFARIRATEP